MLCITVFTVFTVPGCVLTDLLLDLSGLINIEMSNNVGQEGIIIGDYNVGMVCYSLMNPVSN